MTILIANLSEGKETWSHVAKVMAGMEWGKVILVMDKYAKDNFKTHTKFETVLIDKTNTISEIQEALCGVLKMKIKDMEVAVNIVSGTGKEHMALLSALLKLGLGVRFVALTRKGVKEI